MDPPPVPAPPPVPPQPQVAAPAGTPNSEDETNAPRMASPPRQRGSIPSFIFMSFLLFMLTNQNSENFLVRTQYQDALETLAWQMGNYSAWLNGTLTNFTMPERDGYNSRLLSLLVPTGGVPDTQTSSYYTNVTGFIRGPASYYNISPSANYSDNAPSWAPAAGAVVSHANSTFNATASLELFGSWNWSETNRVTLSVVEKLPSTLEGYSAPDEERDQIALIHGRVEMTVRLTDEELHLDFEGVHFLANGSIYGFAEPKGSVVDIRYIPSLVPSEFTNATARVIAPELSTRIGKLRSMLDTGALETEVISDEELITACPFVFKGQLSPTEMSAAAVHELEEEVQHPTGISTIKPPPIIMQGALLSEKCGIVIEMKNSEGLRSITFFRKVTTYAGSAALVYALLLFALLRQMDNSRTPAGLARLSRWTFFIQSGIDAVAFAGHVTFAVLADGRPSIALLVPAFLACILFIYEAHFALLIQQIQLPEDMTSAIPVVTPSPAPAVRPLLSTTVPNTDPAVAYPPNAAACPVGEPNRVAPTTSTPIPTPTTPRPPSFWGLFFRHLRHDPQARLWLAMLLFMFVIVRVVLSPSLALLFLACTHSAFWTVQILRSVRRGRTGGLSLEYLVVTLASRSCFILYFIGCPKNVLDVEPRSWIWLVVLIMFLQVIIIALQDRLGPAFFLPARFSTTDTYDYHPLMDLPDTEAPEASLGDCSICMDTITVDRHELGEKSDNPLLRGMHNAKKTYSVAPCHHVFHTECLERWLAIKNICPQCRRPLPPL